LAMPFGFLQVLPGRLDAAAATADNIRKLQGDLTRGGEIYTILEEGKPRRVGRAVPAKMAGADAFGFVIKSVSTQPGKQQQTRIITQRTLVLNGLQYTLVLFYRAEDSAIAEDTMDKIAAGMKVFKPEAPKTGAGPVTTAPAPVEGTTAPPDEASAP